MREGRAAARPLGGARRPAEPPSLTLVDGNGDELPPSGLWCLMLTDGGRTLKFGAVRGTQVIFR